MKLFETSSIVAALVFSIGFVPMSVAQESDSQPIEADATNQANLKALEARALLETGDFSGAVRVAEEALAIDPNNEAAAWVLAETGDRDPSTDVDERVERWSKLVGTISDPEQRAALLSYVDELRDPLLGSLSVTGLYFGDGDEDQQYGVRSNYASEVVNGRRFTAALEYRKFEIDVPGISPLDLDEDLVRGSIGGSIRNGQSEYHGAVEASTDMVGLSGGITRKRAAGDFGVRARLNTPHWEFSQGASNALAVDEVEVFAQQFGSRFSGNASASVRKYTISDREDLGTSFRATAGGTVMLAEQRDAPRVAVQFYYEDVFDEEFLSFGEPVQIGNPLTPSPVPIRDREILSAGIFKRYGFVKLPAEAGFSEIDLGLGYRADFSDDVDGLFGTVRAEYDFSRDVSLGFTVEYSEVSERQQNADGYVAAFFTLTRKFGEGTS